MDPYLRPLYDALYDLLDQEKVDKLLERNVIEVAPLAFMRGRTLIDAFIIMDEAQNTTKEQMKMFVTRMGNGSKAVITGDLTQIDLPNPKRSGLFEAMQVLEGVEGIGFCHFEDVDVVRHHLVQRIVRAYESYGRRSSRCRWNWAMRGWQLRARDRGGGGSGAEADLEAANQGGAKRNVRDAVVFLSCSSFLAGRFSPTVFRILFRGSAAIRFSRRLPSRRASASRRR